MKICTRDELFKAYAIDMMNNLSEEEKVTILLDALKEKVSCSEGSMLDRMEELGFDLSQYADRWW